MEKEYNEKKSTIANKKRQILRTSPFVTALSILLLIAAFQPPLAAWTMIFAALAVMTPAFYGCHRISRMEILPQSDKIPKSTFQRNTSRFTRVDRSSL